MSLFAYWEEGKKQVLATKALHTIPDWKKQTYSCQTCKEKLAPTKDFTRTKNGNLEFVVAHFKHSPDSTCKEAIQESEEHKSKKAKLLGALFLEKIKLNIYGMEYMIPKPTVKDIEVKRKNNCADVLIEFNNYNPILGNGVAFEIMVSEGYNSINDKKESWAMKGYTLAEIPRHYSIEKIISKGLTIKTTNLEKIMNNIQHSEQILKDLISEIQIKVPEKMTELTSLQEIKFSENENNCSNCYFSTQDRSIEGEPILDTFACWLKKNRGFQRTPDKRDITQICNYYKRGATK